MNRQEMNLPLRSTISLLFPATPLSRISFTAIHAAKTSLSSRVIVRI
jgi:hypothetical protein